MLNKELNQDMLDGEHPSNDLVFCFEGIAIINEALSKLDYIGNYTSSNSASVMSKSIGKQIENLMAEQQKLEFNFEQLIKSKTSKVELVDNNEIEDLKRKIKKNAEELKLSTNNICKSLAENPNIPENLKKASTDKKQIMDKLESFKADLIGGSFLVFNSHMEELRKHNINIPQLRNKEMELFKRLRELNEKLIFEEAEYNKDFKQLNLKLAQKKKELAKSKMEADILSTYRVYS